MPGFARMNESWMEKLGVIFLFNLMVGTGVLAMPGALQRAGWALGIGLVLILGLFSYVTVTFIIECLATANAISRKRYNTAETTPLVPAPAGGTNTFDITEKYEIGQVAVLMTPKWSQVITYFCLCVYLFGDLAIYIVIVGSTARNGICNYQPPNATKENLTDSMPCWEHHTLTRMDMYRISVSVFVFLLGPFVFFNFAKIAILQILSIVLRWIAFFTMFSWSITLLVHRGQMGHPPVIEFSKLPTLFGTLIYSYMCQHSIPGLVQLISNKPKLYIITGVNFVFVTFFYLALTIPAIFAFKTLKDLFLLNFLIEATKPDALAVAFYFALYLTWYPVFTLSTSFPIIGITLRNNLRSMIMGNRPYNIGLDSFLFPLVTIIPPTVLALLVSDIRLLFGVIGSYAGTTIQYFVPCLLVIYARRQQAKEFETQNPYASPFRGKAWISLVFIWWITNFVLITTNYALNWKKN